MLQVQVIDSSEQQAWQASLGQAVQHTPPLPLHCHCTCFLYAALKHLHCTTQSPS